MALSIFTPFTLTYTNTTNESRYTTLTEQRLHNINKTVKSAKQFDHLKTSINESDCTKTTM